MVADGSFTKEKINDEIVNLNRCVACGEPAIFLWIGQGVFIDRFKIGCSDMSCRNSTDDITYLDNAVSIWNHRNPWRPIVP